MSYAEKSDEITKDEWMEKLNNLHVQRADMNRLIMNYLVTGNSPRRDAAGSPSVSTPWEPRHCGPGVESRVQTPWEGSASSSPYVTVSDTRF